MGSNKGGKYNSWTDSDNKTNDTTKRKSEEAKKSPSKNNVHSKVVTSSSPMKRKLQEDKKDSSKEDLRTSDKCDKISKQLSFDNSKNNSASSSASEENKDKSSSGKKVKTVDLFEERIEKKKQRAIMYEKYLQRGGARNPGSKEIPTVRDFTYGNNMNNKRNGECSSTRKDL